MGSRSLRRAAFVAALAALAACLARTVRYDPARDDAAMAAITGTFAEAAPGNVVLSLCEDVAAAPDWTPSCDEQHVVRGGGRGTAHAEEMQRIGCGGCPFGVVAYVVGTVDGGSFAQPAAVRGLVHLQSGHDGDPYAFPYTLELWCEGGAACQLSGTYGGAGGLELRVPVATVAVAHALSRQGAPVCP